tara:strand:- start:797 stop:1243 length:447 start_codon:yes stop_codon:yes gene_type:complete
MISTRRAFLTGLVSLVASPAIVRASSLMPVKVIPFEPYMLVRGKSNISDEMIERKIFEKAGDAYAFLSEGFYRRLGSVTEEMSMRGLQTSAIESREDEKALRMFIHDDPVAYQHLEKKTEPFTYSDGSVRAVPFHWLRATRSYPGSIE